MTPLIPLISEGKGYLVKHCDVMHFGSMCSQHNRAQIAIWWRFQDENALKAAPMLDFPLYIST